ncbi:MAG TPA: type 1 glutamine amidotransferase, partial [Solirubrobacteraceae bacterium]|nr:type 1 glutamine amidotransferase [Solirubrobacteraceae bacterium]
MRVLAIVHEADTGPGVFAEAIHERGAQIEEWCPPDGGPPPRDPGEYDGVIVCGGSAHPDQGQVHEWIVSERAVLGELIDRNVPVLGLCLGAELLAGALGASVGRMSESEIGWYQVQTTESARHDPLIGPLGPESIALEWHSYEFQLPAIGTPLAHSDRCVQAFRAGENAWGIQFHAEVTMADFESWIASHSSDPAAVAIDLDPDA